MSDSAFHSIRQSLQAAALRDAALRSRAPLAIGLGAALCITGFALIGPQAQRGYADDAGILNFLLGEGLRHSPAYQPAYRTYGSSDSLPAIRVVHVQNHRLPAAKRGRVNVAHVRRAPLPPILEASADAAPHEKRVVPLLADSTLRRGDAVMTVGGIRVFRGARKFPFATADFQMLAYAGKVAHKDALLAIDRVSRPGAWSATYSAAVTASSPSAPVMGRSVGTMRVVGDPRGT